ncbi:hypothetical protein PMAYCL1PPCAC_23399, partial [Pristionchus mayeri]
VFSSKERVVFTVRVNTVRGRERLLPLPPPRVRVPPVAAPLQLLLSMASPPPSIRLHRPTALRPSLSSFFLDDPSDGPLDLSLPSRSSVIHPPIQSDPSSSSFDCLPSTSTSYSSSLPTCSNPIPSTRWLADQLAPKASSVFGPTAATVAPLLEMEPHESMTATTSSVAGGSTTTSNPPRMSYPREFKLVVVDYFNNNGRNKYRTCKRFSITKSMLNGWISKVDKIRESRPGSLKSGRSGRKPQFPDIEKHLYIEYENEVAATGNKPGNKWIRDRARQLAIDRADGSQASLDLLNCQFSERWLSNFKKRFNIPIGKECQSAPREKTIEELSAELGSRTDTVQRAARYDEGLESRSSPSTSSTLHALETSDKPSVPFNTDELASELLANSDRLPIHSFYDRFPSLCKKKGGPTTRSVSPDAAKRGRKVQFPKVEEILNARLQNRSKLGFKISNKWLQDEARDIASSVCPESLEEATRQGKTLFSEHWLHNFKKRFNVTASLSSSSETTSEAQTEMDIPSTSTTCSIHHSPSSSFVPIHAPLLHPSLITSSSIPLGGIPSSRTVPSSSTQSLLDPASIEWLLLQQSVGQWYF